MASRSMRLVLGGFVCVSPILAACSSGGSAEPQLLELAGSGTADGGGSHIYIDVESKSQLAGIPYFYEGQLAVAILPFATTQGVKPTERRVAFTALKPSTDGYMAVDRELFGDAEFRATVGVDAEGTTTGPFPTGAIDFEFPPTGPDEESQAHVWFGATWDSNAESFSIQGWDSNAPAGLPLTISGTRQVDLRLTRSGGFVVMSARPTPLTPETDGGWQEVVTVADPLPSEGCSIEFGCEGLDPGNRIFLDYFFLEGPTVAGAQETAPIQDADQTIALVDQARSLVELETPDLAGASGVITQAIVEIADARGKIDLALEAGTFQANTQGKLARKATLRAEKAFLAARTLCDKGNPKKRTTILKQLAAARGHCLVTMANLAGSKATSAKKLPLVE